MPVISNGSLRRLGFILSLGSRSFKPAWKSKLKRLGWSCHRCIGEDAESFLSGLSQGLETTRALQPSWAPPQANWHGGQGAGDTEAVAWLTVQTSHVLRLVGTLGGGSLAWSFAASHFEHMLSSLNWARFPTPEQASINLFLLIWDAKRRNYFPQVTYRGSGKASRGPATPRFFVQKGPVCVVFLSVAQFACKQQSASKRWTPSAEGVGRGGGIRNGNHYPLYWKTCIWMAKFTSCSRSLWDLWGLRKKFTRKT